MIDPYPAGVPLARVVALGGSDAQIKDLVRALLRAASTWPVDEPATAELLEDLIYATTLPVIGAGLQNQAIRLLNFLRPPHQRN